AFAAWFLVGTPEAPGIDPVETGSLPATAEFRLPGEFLQEGRAVDAPVATIRLDQSAEMMRYPVSRPDYMRCVEDRACAAPDLPPNADPYGPYPVTGVSFRDATDYAAWLSRRSGQSWRLPTDAEWSAAAAERLTGEGS